MRTDSGLQGGEACGLDDVRVHLRHLHAMQTEGYYAILPETSSMLKLSVSEILLGQRKSSDMNPMRCDVVVGAWGRREMLERFQNGESQYVLVDHAVRIA